MANTYNWTIVQLDAKIHENEDWQLIINPNKKFKTKFIFELKPSFYE